MNKTMKQLLSMVLAVVMVLALIPASAMPAQAEGDLTIDAYPKEVSVGQSAQLTVTGSTGELSYETSSEAVASVTSDGVVTGVHSGTATITVTDSNGAAGTYEMVVNASTTYEFNTLAFKFGVDAKEDGYADQYYGEDEAAHQTVMDKFGKTNPWYSATDKNFIPAYLSLNDGTTYPANWSKGNNGYVWGRHNENWRLYHVYQDSLGGNEYLNNAPYLTDYAYKNLSNTGLWAMVSYTSNADFYYYSDSSSSYLTADHMLFKLGGNFPDGAFFTNNGDGTYTRGTRQAPYIIMKINVPAAGTYNLNLAAGGTSTTSANYKVYICAADGDITDNGLSMVTDDNYMGNMDATANVSGDLENKFTAPQAGDYYLTIVMEMDGKNYSKTSFMNTSLKSLTMTLDELEEPVLVGENARLSVGQQATIKVTQTGTLSGEKVIKPTIENNNPDVLHIVQDEDGVATVTAISEGTASVTVSYTDLFGISHSKVITYNVIEPGVLKYNFNSFSYKIGVNADDDAYADALDSLDTKPTWYDATDEVFIPAYYRHLVGSSVAYYPSNLGTNGHVYADLANNEKYWYLSLALNTDTANTTYLYSYDYLDTTVTEPFAFTSYSTYNYFQSSASSTAGTHMTQDYIRINHNGSYPNSVFFDSNGGANTRTRPYITMKIQVSAPGTYAVDLVGGEPSTTSANYKVYMAPVDGTTVSDAPTNLMKDQYYIGNLDNSVSESGTLQNRFVAEAAGEYYVCFQLAMDGESYVKTSGSMNSLLKSLTLTPVPADLDGDKVQQSATLSDRITMDFVVTPSGSLIAGYDITFGDAKWQAKLGTDDENDVISFSVGLDANQMYRPIGLQAVDANGDAIGELREYTLGAYLLSIINSTEQEMEEWGITEADKTMAKYTYNYCAKAQIYASKDVDKLEEVEVSIDVPETWNGTTADIVSSDITGIKAKSATLLLGYTLTQRVYFELDEGADLADYVFTVDGASVDAKSEGGKYFVDIEGINPQMCGTDRVVKVTKDGDGEHTVTYSPLDYIQRTYHSTTNETQKDLVLALYGYYLAAADFV